jgi:hypothetical protein
MSVLMQLGCFGPEEVAIASEAFSKSWSFIERDPKLQSHDRQKLQAELARGILETLKTGERDLLHIGNRAIRQLRERMLMADRRSAIRK